MTNRSFNREIRSFTFLLTGFFGSIAILFIIILLINNVVLKASSSYDSIDAYAGGIYTMDYDVSTLDDSEENKYSSGDHMYFSIVVSGTSRKNCI